MSHIRDGILVEIVDGFLYMTDPIRRVLPLSIRGFKKKCSDIISERRGGWIFIESDNYVSSLHSLSDIQLNITLFEYWFPVDMIFALFEEGGTLP